MEAPEKIYLEWYHIGDKKYREWVITPKTNNEPVEYTRTDAVIEKATSYIQQHWIWNTKMIEDFKNYMKGRII